jgi:hypothetical protein
MNKWQVLRQIVPRVVGHGAPPHQDIYGRRGRKGARNR